MKKLLSLLVIVSMLVSPASISLTSDAVDQEKKPFEEKLFYETANSVQKYAEDGFGSGEEVDSVSVTLQFEETFACSHSEFESFSDVMEHREELTQYYTVTNAAIAEDLSLEDYSSMSISSYGPFIQFHYEDYETFALHDYGVLADKNYETMSSVYVRENYGYTSCATASFDDSPLYPITEALEDVGIPAVKTYDGTGVKVGILDLEMPNSTVNFGDEPYRSNAPLDESPHSTHSFIIHSILGGPQGIASGAEIYFAKIVGNSMISPLDWLVGQGVNVVNGSFGYAAGTFTSDSAYVDYIVRETKLTYVGAAGNERLDNFYQGLVGSPSTGANVICVAANDIDGRISSYSSYNMYDETLLKPTLCAPGGEFTGLPNINAEPDESLSGTSYAAPIVTGIVALLMQEFPDLKLYPEKVLSLLTNTTTHVKCQSYMVDEDAGFGMVNYANARTYYPNAAYFSIPTSTDTTTVLYTKTITIPAKTHFRLNGVILSATPKHYIDSGIYAPLYVTLSITAKDVLTGVVVQGDITANFTHLMLYNSTNDSRNYLITVTQSFDKSYNFVDHAAISYSFVSQHMNTYQYEDEGSYHANYCHCGNCELESHTYEHAYTNEGTNHKVYCVCGNCIVENHVYDRYYVNMIYYHTVMCVCDSTINQNHVYDRSYSYIDSTKHYVSCVCGERTEEEHVFFSDPTATMCPCGAFD